MIVLDASVLIAYLDRDDVHHRSAVTALAAAIDDRLAVGVLTLAEVLVQPARDGRLATVQDLLHALEVEELPFPSRAAVRLAQLRADTGLKLPDCAVLLAAEAASAHLASFDERLIDQAQRRGVPVLA